ncbi:chemotaxis protein CheA [Paenibacillus allorhizosphaerae]|uniref:Chemotaxis protein CheA n=1 Tax=Paenibacillus allorhizosphaerae TaxID=2849866 RepID=A0ABM8VIU4_9BACL|nr:chemotaxis protein CheA [Paenibacillus allorhizosphaerae]CAG7644453.1 Chemotaxis protein CheA [Paenibacillus allorhizosphaerae]
MLSEYKELFQEELQDQLQLMDDEILKLEQHGASDQVIQSLFRAAHTLKGSSAAMGFEEMKQVTHEMEHLLDQVRNKKLGVSGPLIDLLFKSLDCLKRLKSDFEGQGYGATEISGTIRELQSFTETPGNQPESAATGHGPALNLHMTLKMEEALDKGAAVYWIRVQISADCFIKGARMYVIHSNLSEWGEVLFSDPELDAVDEQCQGLLPITFLYAGGQSAEELHRLVAGLTDVAEVHVDPASVQAEGQVSIEPAISAKPAEPSSERLEPSIEPSREHRWIAKTQSQTIRVSVERLEHLMNLVGELVIDQTRIHQVKRMISRRYSDEAVSELGQVADHLTRIIGDLQESVMKARMLPIEQLFNRFPRMIRDLSRDLGKEIEMVIEGKDTELDRTLIEEIADPLIHLIRNAIDHGIELPEKRRQAGKAAKGTLRIRAAHEDNQVVVYVEDDGAGIDPGKMKKSAIQKGILSQAEAEQLTDREAIGLIFRPGFSTAHTVSDISGRGVGMDIVRSHIEKLNGLIDIETKLGAGTRFIIKLPLTLAIITGLLIRLHEQTFIIPMSNITEIIRVTPSDITTVRGQSVISLRNQVIPVAWMHDHFQIPRKHNGKKHIPLVIVGSADKRLALAVDELIGNQEVVIKSMGSYVGKMDCIAGATILGNGKVALILEISGVISKLGK